MPLRKGKYSCYSNQYLSLKVNICKWCFHRVTDGELVVNSDVISVKVINVNQEYLSTLQEPVTLHFSHKEVTQRTMVTSKTIMH